ncbi:MAG: DNRLRE domain-containing protein [Planctomycetota bacterium]|jgi:hypothetical protein
MFKRLISVTCIGAALGIFCGPRASADIIIPAVESCRADGGRPDENRHDSSKLSIRATSTGWKSWIKFELGNLEIWKLESATLTVALNRPKDSDQSFDVSYVNDDYLDNIEWDERSLTWNNAPGNNTADTSTVDPTKTTFLTTVNFADGLAGDAFTIDILGALQADTDGIVQFILHNGSANLDCATHDHAEEAWRPFIDATLKPETAHDPNPEDGETDVIVANTVLSWKAGLNPDDPDFPNPAIVEHYLWLSTPYDPATTVEMPAEWWEAAGVRKWTIGADTNPADGQVDPNVSQDVTGLEKDKLYYWFVDEGLVGSSGPLETDPTKIIWGNFWRFKTETTGPEVDAGPNVVTWLDEATGIATVVPDANVTDPSGDLATILWMVESPAGDPNITILNDPVEDPTVEIVATGTYILKVKADDVAGNPSGEDTMEIRVYADSCEAAQNNPNGYDAPQYDFNGDCVVDFLDFAMCATEWAEDRRLVTNETFE